MDTVMKTGLTQIFTKTEIINQAKMVLARRGEVAAARFLVKNVFGNMLDRQGKRYINHLEYVAASVKDPRDKAIGLLHDLLEQFSHRSDYKDSNYNGEPWTIDDLIDIGFSEYTTDGVTAFTKKPGEKYFDRMVRLATTPQYIPIKLFGDLKHNRSPRRREDTADYKIRMEKYRLSALYLASVLKFVDPQYDLPDEFKNVKPVAPGTSFASWMIQQEPANQNTDLLRQFSDSWLPALKRAVVASISSLALVPRVQGC
jgi:hypothetical protein